ncbi:unnamed protein product [Durusdinium trenchii]|uniref:Endonuclease/exonuclease/phosphatase domain-containing protein n=1 Tax=Durusdinium trenchii TaxID=1381693 RepID=A0ABP0SGY4_9DINO
MLRLLSMSHAKPGAHSRRPDAEELGKVDPEDLLICCFQEVWSWHKGPLMDCTARLDPSKVTQFWENFVLSLGILFRWLSCCRVWDTAARLFAAKEDPRIEYAVVVGHRGMSLSSLSLIDSGLCILATRAPGEKGFVAYKSYPGGFHEERLCNKGLIWAFWSHQAGLPSGGSRGVLVVNTHLSSEDPVRPGQLAELKRHVEKLRTDFSMKCAHLEMYVCGDFNYDPNGFRQEFFRTWYQELGLQRLTGDEPTCSGATLDHIFFWRSNGKVGSKDFQCSEPRKPWRDWCTRSRETLSDHCWQGLVLSESR